MAFLRAASLGTLAAAAFFTLPPAFANTGDASPLGVWVDDTGRGAVEIKSCGGDNLCGHVVWVRDAKDANGCGRQIIGAAHPTGGKGMYQGWIYSPEKKKRFDVEFAPAASGKLRVTGFAGIRLFSRTMYWTRANGDLVRCQSGQTAQAAPTSAHTLATPAAPRPELTGMEPGPAAKADGSTPVAKPSAQAAAASTLDNSARNKAASDHPADSPAASVPSQPAARSGISTAEKSGAAPADTPAAGGQSSNGADADSASDDGGSGLSGLNLGGMNLGKVISRNGGTCRLDLPWVKVRFGCKDL